MHDDVNKKIIKFTEMRGESELKKITKYCLLIGRTSHHTQQELSDKGSYHHHHHLELLQQLPI
jgi:hypothetical protein